MTRLSFCMAMLLGTVLGCQSEPPTTGCPPDALAFCALRPTLVVTGQLRRAAQPIAGAEIRATAYAGACGNQVVDVLPSPADAVTDEPRSNQVPSRDFNPLPSLSSAPSASLPSASSFRPFRLSSFRLSFFRRAPPPI